MALESDDNFVSFGTALEPIEEEEVARKKPITIAEQIATDEQGRRRFHGAFTGGFSAGYFNTVGSKEGWTPSTFKSSRAERFSKKEQNVTDFMDSEDMGAFGIAPQVLRPTDDFSTAEAQSKSRKRARPTQSDGPIPGTPVLNQIIEPVKETVGIKILIKMGWRPGQGVGAKVARKKKEKPKKDDKVDILETDLDKPVVVDEEEEIREKAAQKVYGCQLPAELARQDEPSSDEEMDVDVLYAPEDVDSPLCNPKENTFGLGYKGLERMSETAPHVDLFGNNQLKFRVDNKKMNITGEAFGIGAFEEPDLDVYNREDMSSYDFELETPEERKKRKAKEALEKSKKKHKDNCIAGFHFAKSTTVKKKHFPPPHLPHDFQPIHKQRKSRFEKPAVSENDSTAKKGLGRHALTAQERQVLLGEEPVSAVVASTSIVQPAVETAIPLPPELDPSIQERVERIKKFVQVLQTHGVSDSGTEQPAIMGPAFKPFLKNPEKQERYERYLTLVASGFQDSLRDLQPHEMTEWEREREKQEFEKARAMYKPLNAAMSSRFVSAKSHDISHIVPEKEIILQRDPSEDPKVAAKLGLFGKLTHFVEEWHPDKLVCKRFNMKDPYPDSKFVGLRTLSAALKPIAEKDVSNSEIVSSVDTDATHLTPVPKKSLFDNLDFSKPPPGFVSSNLLPAGESGEASSALALEFQSDLQSRNDDKENVPVKAPLDLFKQIFADSSESESEENEPPMKSQVNNEDNESQKMRAGARRERTELSRGKDDTAKERPAASKILFEKRYDEKKVDKGKQEPRKGSKSIFDDLDFNQVNQKPGSLGDRERQVLDEDDSEQKQERGVETVDDLLYGPKAPIQPLVKSKPSQPITSSVSSQVPNTYTKTLHPSSSSKGKEEEVVWVEKEAVIQSHSSGSSSKTKKHSSKKSKKSKSKKAKSKEKHKKSKKHKTKRSKHKSPSGHSRPDSSSNSSSDSEDSSSSVEIQSSLNQKALLAQLKQITRSH